MVQQQSRTSLPPHPTPIFFARLMRRAVRRIAASPRKQPREKRPVAPGREETGSGKVAAASSGGWGPLGRRFQPGEGNRTAATSLEGNEKRARAGIHISHRSPAAERISRRTPSGKENASGPLPGQTGRGGPGRPEGTMAARAALLLLLLGVAGTGPTPGQGSRGDREPVYQDCLARCERRNCSEAGLRRFRTHQPLYMRFTGVGRRRPAGAGAGAASEPCFL